MILPVGGGPAGPTSRHRDPDLFVPKQCRGQLMAVTLLALFRVSSLSPSLSRIVIGVTSFASLALTIVVMVVSSPSVHSRVSSLSGVIIVTSFSSLVLTKEVIVAITLSRVSSFPFAHLSSSSLPLPVVPHSSSSSPLFIFAESLPCPFPEPSCPYHHRRYRRRPS